MYVYGMDSLCIQEKEKEIEKEKEKQNNKKNNKKSNSKFIPPTLDEINDYIKEKSLKVDGKFFYDYFTTGKWVDSKGNKVKNWKQKLLTWDKHQITVRNAKKKFSNSRDYENEILDNLYANRR